VPRMYRVGLTLAALITAASVVSSPALAGRNINAAGGQSTSHLPVHALTAAKGGSFWDKIEKIARKNTLRNNCYAVFGRKSYQCN
jgi:hypothetical protein